MNQRITLYRAVARPVFDGPPLIEIQRWIVERLTPHGAWLRHGPIRKWSRTRPDGTKFARLTEVAAVESLAARSRLAAEHFRRRLKAADAAAREAEKLLACRLAEGRRT